MAASQQWASSDFLTRSNSQKSFVGATVTAVASAGRVATAFHGLVLKACLSRIGVATFVSIAKMMYLASAATLASQCRTNVLVGHVTHCGSSTLTVLSAGLGLITTTLFSWP